MSSIPGLATTLQSPLHRLEQSILDNHVNVEAWFREQWHLTPPPFYCSVDLRNSGFKIAPVDTNLFPAGFNNLNQNDLPLAIQAVQATAERICPDATSFLLVPESHSRNINYFESIASLQAILEGAGYEVRVGSLMERLTQAKDVALPSGRSVRLEPLVRKGKRIYVDDFSPCCVLLNNDMAGGVPAELQDLEQKLIPPVALGWATRYKSAHFQHYQNVCQEFATQIDADPWLLSPLFRYCGEVDFMTREGEDCLVRHATILLEAIKKKYEENNIDLEPFLVIKSDTGTYGMAVMMIKSPDEIHNLNRKQRTKMAASKGGGKVGRVIIQEGVYSFETWGEDKAVTEPVVYMIGPHVIGGFYRVHQGRGVDENLNAPGMNFEPLPFTAACNNPGIEEDNPQRRFYAYGVIARLALLAAAREVAEHGGDQ